MTEENIPQQTPAKKSRYADNAVINILKQAFIFVTRTVFSIFNRPQETILEAGDTLQGEENPPTIKRNTDSDTPTVAIASLDSIDSANVGITAGSSRVATTVDYSLQIQPSISDSSVAAMTSVVEENFSYRVRNDRI